MIRGAFGMRVRKVAAIDQRLAGVGKKAAMAGAIRDRKLRIEREPEQSALIEVFVKARETFLYIEKRFRQQAILFDNPDLPGLINDEQARRRIGRWNEEERRGETAGDFLQLDSNIPFLNALRNRIIDWVSGNQR